MMPVLSIGLRCAVVVSSGYAALWLFSNPTVVSSSLCQSTLHCVLTLHRLQGDSVVSDILEKLRDTATSF